MISSDTQQIGFWRVLAFFLLGPVIAMLYAIYSFGYWMERKGVSRVILIPYGVIFILLNVLHNLTVCTILFFPDLPREFLTTQRLKRWKKSDDPSRRELADMMGGFLNSQDENHY